MDYTYLFRYLRFSIYEVRVALKLIDSFIEFFKLI